MLAAAIFVALQQAYLRAAPGIKDFIARRLNAKVAGAVIGSLSPGERVRVEAGKVLGERAAVDIKNGCEGFEVMLLFAASVLAYPMRWRVKGPVLVAGAALIYIANIVRIVSLYYIAAFRPDWFDPAHVLVWQTLMILLVLAIFLASIGLDRRVAAGAGHGGGAP
jgi:exosortase family protein XrtM